MADTVAPGPEVFKLYKNALLNKTGQHFDFTVISKQLYGFILALQNKWRGVIYMMTLARDVLGL